MSVPKGLRDEIKRAERPAWEPASDLNQRERVALRIYRALKANLVFRSEWAIALDVAEQIINDLKAQP